jgi:hypothetical protein
MFLLERAGRDQHNNQNGDNYYNNGGDNIEA